MKVTKFHRGIEFKKYIHDLHNGYPLAPERLMLSKVEKLVNNLNNKKNALQYENLIQNLNMGKKVTKFHKGIEFKQSNWLKPYIEFNTEIRTKSTSDFEKFFFN